MIQKLTAIVNFSGETFSPRKAEDETGLKFTKKHEPGDIAKTGKFKGKPTPLGSASLEAPSDVQEHEIILWLGNTLTKKIQTIKECGAEDAYFYIGYFYIDQCNCSLSREELQVLANTGIDFWFSCYDITNDS